MIIVIICLLTAILSLLVLKRWYQLNIFKAKDRKNTEVINSIVSKRRNSLW